MYFWIDIQIIFKELLQFVFFLNEQVTYALNLKITYAYFKVEIS